MNILPKKRWHVRTKDNIARVRRDEAKAEAELREKEKRAKIAEQEARMSLLRGRASTSNCDIDEPEKPPQLPAEGHVNFFADLEVAGNELGNKEHEAEKKREQEEYEKKIGLLTYLGQDTNELTGAKSWWQKLPEKRDTIGDDGDDPEKKSSSKELLDPLHSIRRHLGSDGVRKLCEKRARRKEKKKDKKSKKKKKKRSRSSSPDSSSDEKRKKLARLRAERVEREKKERARAQRVLSGLADDPEPDPAPSSGQSSRKYNSQFNPEIARQNRLDAKKKYWLDQE